jgi:hypothetical protein
MRNDHETSALVVICAIFGAALFLIVMILWPVLMEWWGR